jgi:plasmid replication initiation protein
VAGVEVVTSYTRWVESVLLKEGENQEVYVTFSLRFEHLWLESKKRLPAIMKQKPANSRLRSKSALRLYGCANKYLDAGSKSISLEDLRTVLDLQSIKDADGNVIKETPIPIWANFKQRALDTAIREINAKTDLRIKVASIERSAHRRVVALTFAIKAQQIPKLAQSIEIRSRSPVDMLLI